MTDLWRVDPEKTIESWLEVNDPEGWYHASVRFDGCIHFYRYFGSPRGTDSDEDVDSLHICDVDDLITRLQALKAEAARHFGEAWPG